MKKFWYVSRDPATVGYHDPKHAFFTKEEAKKEAEGLCRKTGHDFYVMEAVELVKQSKPPIEWLQVPEAVSRNNWYDQRTYRYRDSLGRFTRG